MKILLVQRIAGIGGSERYLAEIIPALNKKGHDCTFLNLYSKQYEIAAKEYSKILRSRQVEVIELDINSILNPVVYNKLSKIFKEGDFDIIHSHLIYADFLCAVTKMLFNRQLTVVSTKHGYLEAYLQKYGLALKKTGRDAYWWIAYFSEKFINRSFAVSKAVKELFLFKNICHNNKIDVIYHGINIPDGFSYNSDFRHSSIQLVMVGRLIRFKGHDYALNALKILVQKFPEIKLVIVGTGPDEAHLKAKVLELGIADKVIFTGFSDRPLDYMHTSDIVLVPSIGEPFGLVTLEAISVGRPVVAFDVPAANEIIEHEKTGMLAKPFDTEDLANQIAKLITDPKKGELLLKNAVKLTTTKFSFDKMVEETSAFYLKVFADEN